jgi:hypothetical protein
MNQKKEITSGAIRIATRTGIEPRAWAYQTLDISTDDASIFGFDVALVTQVYVMSGKNKEVTASMLFEFSG